MAAEIKPIFTKNEKEKRISAEEKKLFEIFEKEDELVSDLVKRVAFLRVALDEAQGMINRDGMVETYQNGANQFGQKKSVALEAYNMFAGQYLKAIKQLKEFAPEDVSEKCDEFLEFVNR